MKETVEKLNEFAARVEKARGAGPSVETYHDIFSAFYREAAKEMLDLLPRKLRYGMAGDFSSSYSFQDQFRGVELKFFMDGFNNLKGKIRVEDGWKVVEVAVDDCKSTMNWLHRKLESLLMNGDWVVQGIQCCLDGVRAQMKDDTGRIAAMEGRADGPLVEKRRAAAERFREFLEAFYSEDYEMLKETLETVEKCKEALDGGDLKAMLRLDFNPVNRIGSDACYPSNRFGMHFEMGHELSCRIQELGLNPDKTAKVWHLDLFFEGEMDEGYIKGLIERMENQGMDFLEVAESLKCMRENAMERCKLVRERLKGFAMWL